MNSLQALPHKAVAYSAPTVVIIIVTHNGKRHLERSLPSLARTDYDHYEVWLVDNASTDDTVAYTHANFPNVKILQNVVNDGFARANNRAMKQALAANAQYVFLLNDDTEILDGQWLGAAIKLAESDPSIGMVGFRLVGHDMPPQVTGDVAAVPVETIEGCALLIRSEVLRKLGFFDEVYFAYAEEIDLEMRAGRAGYKLFELNIPIFHLGAGTSRRFPIRRTYLVMRNYIRHSIKNRNCGKTLLRIVRTFDISSNPWPLFYDPKDTTHQKMRGNGNYPVNFVLFVAALLWNLLHLPQTLLIRYRESQLVNRARFGNPADAA